MPAPRIASGGDARISAGGAGEETPAGSVLILLDLLHQLDDPAPQLHGQDAIDFSGRSVSAAGDINGDGFDDLIIGAVQGDGPGNTRYNAGDSYVVFGHAGSFAAEIDLAAVATGAGGFVIHGQDAADKSGFSVSSAGDVNGDGFDDLVIGAPDGDGPGNTRNDAGDSYVVFGHVRGARRRRILRQRRRRGNRERRRG